MHGYVQVLAVFIQFAILGQASESDPGEILRKSAAALAALKSATYHVECRGEGSLSGRVPEFSGDIYCLRMESGGVAVRVEGVSPIAAVKRRPGKGGTLAFRAFFQNGQGTFCGEKLDPLSSTLVDDGPGTVKFNHIVIPMLLQFRSFDSEIEHRPKLRPNRTIGGVACYVIAASRRDFGQQIWCIGTSDFLPRRIEHVARTRQPGERVYEITNLKINLAFKTEDFIAPPIPLSPQAQKAAHAAQEFEKRLVKSVEELRQVRPPAGMTLPDWSSKTTLSAVVSSWLKKWVESDAVSAYDNMGLHVELTNSANRDRARLWNTEEPADRVSSTPKDPRLFESDLTALHYLAALDMDQALDNVASASSYRAFLQKDTLGNTPLDYAALYGRTASVRLLWRYSSNCNVDRVRPLCLAAAMGHAETIRAMLELGAQANSADATGTTPLEYALENGNDATIDCLFRAIIRHDPELPIVRRPVKEFVRPVLAAIRNKRIDSVRRLAKYVDLSTPLDAEDIGLSSAGAAEDSDRVTLLHYAAAHSDAAVVDFLVKDMGFKAASFDHHGRPPLFFACSLEIAAYLLKSDDTLLDHTDEHDRNVAHYLAARNSVDALNYFLKKRPGLLEAKDSEKCTPIVYAVHAGATDALQLLLDSGADVHVITNDSTGILSGLVDKVIITALGETVGEWFVSDSSALLHISSRLGDKKSTGLLLRKGLKAGAKDKCGRNILIIALVHKKLEYVRWLLDCKKERSLVEGNINLLDELDLDSATDNGCVALHFAAADGQIDIMEKLVDMRASINTPVRNIIGPEDVADFFTGCGLGLKIGATPLDLARRNQHWDLAHRLQKLGAKSGLRDEK